MKTIVALFDYRSNADAAVQDLLDFGIQRDDVSLIANNSQTEKLSSDSTLADSALPSEPDRRSRTDTVGETTADSALAGAAVGGVGGILLGLTALVIPGVGPVVAAGPLIAGLIGAGVGAAVGGLVGALAEAGVPEEQAGYFAEGVRRGGTLVSVIASDQDVPEIVNIMNRHDPVDVEERASLWRDGGWSGYSEYEGHEQRTPATSSPLVGVAATYDRTRTPADNPDQPGYLDRSHSVAQADSEELRASGEETWTGISREERNSRQALPASYQADDDESSFRTHYQNNYAGTGRSWADYATAYRYGSDLRNEERYRHRNWAEIEADARRDWSRNHAGSSWEDFKDAIRHGWERTKQAVGA